VLTTKVVKSNISFVLDIQVIEDPAAVIVALEPMRSRLLSELAAPASAATLAARVGLARQKINYHLNALEAHGLVRLARERKWGGLTERLLVATAASYVVSPGALGPVAADPRREVDRLSASYLIALGARVVREVADLVRRADMAGKRLATLAVDTEVRFRSPADRAAFSAELAEAITKLVSKYHDASAPGGRAHRLVVVAHPLSAYAAGSGETSPKRLRPEGGPQKSNSTEPI
jgi:DNA-binding transcriptional ArsR family regulator